jgi:hypothetical protein
LNSFSEVKPPLDNWTTEEVTAWFTTNYNAYAEIFEGMNGAELAVLEKVDFETYIPGVKGTALYRAIQNLKGSCQQLSKFALL